MNYRLLCRKDRWHICEVLWCEMCLVKGQHTYLSGNCQWSSNILITETEHHWFCLSYLIAAHIVFLIQFTGRECAHHYILYILESNPHPFYSFRGLKNQMQIRIVCGLDSRSWAGFFKNDRAAVHAVRTNNTIIYYFIYYFYYIIFIIYYSSDSPSSLITESVCLVGKGRLKERCGLEPRTNFFFV